MRPVGRIWYICVCRGFVVIHSKTKIEEVYDKSMEVLEKRQQQKRCQVVQTGGSEDYGLTLTMNFLILNSNEFHICLYSFSTK